MNPALSIVFFTTLAGCGQGLVVVVAAATLAGSPPGDAFVALALVVAGALLCAGLAASFLHLGHPKRAWRAAAMWRTSWMSREVIVLPAFIGLVALWWFMVVAAAPLPVLRTVAAAALVLALALWHCTAMIYACLRFVQEWAHPLTIVNFTLIGLSSGLIAAGALASLAGDAGFARAAAPWGLAVTLAAWTTRVLSLRRNAALEPASTLQSATGINAGRVVQQAMGMTTGSFNTREFFHHQPPPVLRRVKRGFILAGFALPTALLIGVSTGGAAWGWLLAAPLQFAGLVAERWYFFAEARHPQNLYYQTVS